MENNCFTHVNLLSWSQTLATLCLAPEKILLIFSLTQWIQCGDFFHFLHFFFSFKSFFHMKPIVIRLHWTLYKIRIRKNTLLFFSQRKTTKFQKWRKIFWRKPTVFSTIFWSSTSLIFLKRFLFLLLTGFFIRSIYSNLNSTSFSFSHTTHKSKRVMFRRVLIEN